MKYVPKTASLAEAIYRDIDKNEYLNEIYEALLYNYSIDLFGLDRPQKQVQIKDALRFADLLSKSTYAPTATGIISGDRKSQHSSILFTRRMKP